MSTRALVRPEGSPSLRYCHKSHLIKQEDIVFVYDDLQRLTPQPDQMGKWDLFCLCDGHGGREAADFALTNLPALIAQGLPAGSPPDTDTPEGQRWLQVTRAALNKAFIELDSTFQKQCAFPNVGSTMTVALFCNWLLTIANIGDSEAFLDLGNGRAIEVTTSDKIDTNQSEQSRLRRCGNQISALSEDYFRPAMSHEEGIGPLRVWPCGLAVSRAIGDQDCGHAVLASPHIKQIKIPFSGARLTIASDGLWDHLTPDRVIKRSRKHTITQVPVELIAKARDVSEYGLTDDTSVLVIDVVPTPKIDFKEISRKIRGPRSMISRLSKKLGKNKSKTLPSVVLVTTDMADSEQLLPLAPNSFLSSKSIGGSQRSKVAAQLARYKTIVSHSNSKVSSESEEESTSENEVIAVSLNLDNVEGPHCPIGTRPLERFMSSTVN
eukprot:g5994.t1